MDTLDARCRRRWNFTGRAAALGCAASAFVAVAAFMRIALFARWWGEAAHGVVDVGAALLVGLLFDVAAMAWLALPFALWTWLVPERIWATRVHRWTGLALWGAYCYGVALLAAVEWGFFEEFGARFNFIAVDYLVYTKEVAGNVWESYPMPAILASLTAPAGVIFLLTWRFVAASLAARSTIGSRWRAPVVVLGTALGLWAALPDGLSERTGNRYTDEIAKDGVHALFSAFWKNRLDYEAYYETRPLPESVARLRTLVAKDGSTALPSEDGGADLLRRVVREGPEKRLNVVVVTIESLSARFLGHFGEARDPKGLTPVLDRLAGESVFFTDYYATGIRTVRGLEALSLSVPPTPGQSVVKRPGTGGMFTLGQIFGRRGYDCAFVYGGYGMFDEMNAFFGGNGFRCVDRTALSKNEITFANVWGVCDEDLYARTLRECDESHRAGKPFLRFVMTTSNHQPFTYPDGKVDIPSGDGRGGAVRYTDFALGRFLEAARTRPWFDDTVFVIGADHCENARGRTDLPVEKFHIPLLIWSPKHVRPQVVSGVCSQIDMAPTLLGVLNWTYESRFFGQDLLRSVPNRAFLCNYLTLGLYDGERLVSLGARKTVRVELAGPSVKRPVPAPRDARTQELVEDAVAWFQGAAHLIDAGRQKAR